MSRLLKLLPAAYRSIFPSRRIRKFFNEVHGKYDARYFREELFPPQSIPLLGDMLAVFMEVCRSVDVKPILGHGALIGWWWSKQLLPWDDDIDLLIAHDELYALQPLHSKVVAERYLFEINPNHVVRETLNKTHSDWAEPNRIDARFIDTRNGLYIDITALHVFDGRRLSTKCPHIFEEEQFFPLRGSTLAGIPVFVPADVETVLQQEYGNEVLTRMEFNGYAFDRTDLLWKPDAGLRS